ncbi:hypothetical protein SBA5_720014 [Candidatus Sulfotelmatomonas gaucii]|uniref:Uncharacterized protein n=1 Tax=Candidatus Sulfuritelmatomonas gaucii TaxID=2043161 RepID=A0A2N9M2Y9_9BACT|nr:hypothetical protein SBA5_720014 [Candidatus Sulfotelmatomonas gaucii]
MLAAQNPDSTTISKLLEDVKSHAALADDDAHTLASYTRSNVGWQTHGTQLTRIKEHVNDLVRDGNQMSSPKFELNVLTAQDLTARRKIELGRLQGA